MIASRQFRLAAVAALEGAGLALNGAPVSINSPGDWNLVQDDLPDILVRAYSVTKEGRGRGVPLFDSVIQVDVRAVVKATTAEAAQDALELLWGQVELTMLTDPAIGALTQFVAGVTTQMDIKSEGQVHLAGMVGQFRYQTFESFDRTELAPDEFPPLLRVTLDADLLKPADPLGTYPSPLFPGSVVPAPRTQGPDGRPEGGLDLPLTGA